MPLTSNVFPDANLRAALSLRFGVPEGQSIPQAQVNALTYLSINNKGIRSLTGLGYFTNLSTLEASNNSIVYLPEALKKLQYVDLSYNKFTSFTTYDYLNLVELNLSGNYDLTAVSVSGSTALKKLRLTHTSITSLDLSKNTQLTELNCFLSKLTSLDLRQNTQLTYLNCASNNLTELDVQWTKQLEYLNCEYNKITKISHMNLSKQTLKQVICSSNKLEGYMEFYGWPKLEYIDVSNNAITGINVDGCASLNEIRVFSNKITSQYYLDYFFNWLPQKPAGAVHLIYYLNTDNESNVINATLNEKARAKGWYIMEYYNGKWVAYDHTSTGINDVNLNGNDNNAPRYNLSGQRVDDSYRGVVISNGKKMVKR